MMKTKIHRLEFAGEQEFNYKEQWGELFDEGVYTNMYGERDLYSTKIGTGIRESATKLRLIKGVEKHG